MCEGGIGCLVRADIGRWNATFIDDATCSSSSSSSGVVIGADGGAGMVVIIEWRLQTGEHHHVGPRSSHYRSYHTWLRTLSSTYSGAVAARLDHCQHSYRHWMNRCTRAISGSVRCCCSRERQWLGHCWLGRTARYAHAPPSFSMTWNNRPRFKTF